MSYNTVQVDTTCNSNIDLSIRQGLLESMAGKRLIMYHAGGGNALSQNRAVIFNASGSFWTTYENINAGGVANCKDKLTFDQATGTVTIDSDITTLNGIVLVLRRVKLLCSLLLIRRFINIIVSERRIML